MSFKTREEQKCFGESRSKAAKKVTKKKEELSAALVEALGGEGLQSLIDNQTSAVCTGFSNKDGVPVVVFFTGKYLLMEKDKKYAHVAGSRGF
ncbi:MAG: hypothetical protein GY853_01785 [PVC group bacterium]|nr:hypothetical protein [PVC group bacterium]